MSDIPKHDREQERERDHGEKPGVDFLVRGDPIAVHDRLEPLRKLVRADERRRRLPRPQHRQNRRHIRTRLLLHSHRFQHPSMNKKINKREPTVACLNAN